MGSLPIPAVSQAALSRFDEVILWLGLSGGKRESREYLPTNPKRDDHKPGSFSINVDTGVWSEFATGDGGGDLVSLAAYIRGCKQGEAARELAGFLGLQEPGYVPSAAVNKGVPGENGVCCIPVPDGMPPVPLAHPRHGKPERRYTYTDTGGKVAFYVDRYATPSGKSFAQITVWKTPSGALEWRWKAPPPKRLLYGLADLSARSDAPVMACEGEKATEAARALFPGFVVVCWPGGANAVRMADFSPLADRNVMLWADLDEPGTSAMRQVAETLHGLKTPPVAIYQVKPDFFGLSEKGADAADLARWDAARCAEACSGEEWRGALQKPEKKAVQGRKPAASAHVSGRFVLKQDGVYYDADPDGGDSPKWICSPLEVIGYSRDSDGMGWGLFVRFKDPDGKAHEVVIPKRLFVGESHDVLRILSDEGLRVGAGKPSLARIIEYLVAQNPTTRIRTAKRTGWHGVGDARVFVMPDAVFGAENEEWRYEVEGAAENPFSVSGRVVDWREHVGRLCVGNSRLAFAVSVAFAAPLLELASCESGGFHFRGNSSDGKTTALRVACSVAGGRGYMQRWRATDNALESIAMQFCDALLTLDEIAQIDGRIAGETAYMLSNGSAKARATRTGAIRGRGSWRVLYLSAGEISLSMHVSECGKTSRAGQEVRLVDIPADAGAGFGVFENLHGHANGADFSNALMRGCEKFHGAAFRGFLGRLI